MNVIIDNKKIKLNDFLTFFQKLKGLMFKKETINEIYLLKNCHSIHTFFMFQNIDICMTDKFNNIVFLKANVKPWRIIICKKAHNTYEMPLNTIKMLSINEKLTIK